jgi:hypothetical protein
MEHLSRKIVTSIADIQIDIDNQIDNLERTIYLVPALEGLSQDIYDEYMVINGSIEKMGSWEANLEDYVTKTTFEETLALTATKAELEQKVNVEPGKGLSANDFTTEFKTKLETLPADAEKNAV